MNINDLKEARINAGLSQKNFCKLTDVPLGTLRNWEQGLSTPPEYVITLLVDKVNEWSKKDHKFESPEYYFIYQEIHGKICSAMTTKDEFFYIVDSISGPCVIRKYNYKYSNYSEETYVAYCEKEDKEQLFGCVRRFGD